MANVKPLAAPALADSGGMRDETMTVSPAQAQQWLDTMPHQRRMRGAQINKLKRLILEGRWRLLPHGIVIDRNGKLIDGQHRLTAIVQADRPVPLRVTFGAAPEMYSVIGSDVAPKTLEDMLRHEGCSTHQSRMIPEALLYLFNVQRGRSPFVGTERPSTEEGRELFYDNPGLIDAADLAVRCELARQRTILTYFIYKALQVNEAGTRHFIDKLATGEGLRAGDPALLLRNSWIKDRTAKIARARSDQAQMFLKTLEAALSGKAMHSWRNVEFGKGATASSMRFL